MASEVGTGMADELLQELFTTEEGRRDPYPRYHRLREVAPFYRSQLDGVWYASAYAECRLVLGSPRCGRDGDQPGRSFAFRGVRSRPARFRVSMLSQNPPDHTRLRGLVSQAFTPGRIRALEPRIAELTDARLDVMADKGAADVMADLAFPLPVTVIGELVGVPAEDREQFRDLVNRRFLVEPDPESIRRSEAANDAMEAYFIDLIERRRTEPEDDLLSGLVAAHDEQGSLSEDELLAMVMLLFLAGFVTTTNLIGNGLLALLSQPVELARLWADPSLVPLAVQEMLRYDSPVQVIGRAVFEPLEAAGQRLEPGDSVVCLLGAANRDPEQFAAPDRLDVGRRDRQPLSFGWGIHHCLGAGLASLEGQIVFARMIERFRTIELLDEDPPRRPGSFLRGLDALPVRVVPA